MKKHQRTVGLNDEWITPESILDPLGIFDLDPCCAIKMPWPTAKECWDIRDDGLNREWYPDQRVWLNPPFNRYQRPKWMEKMSNHRNGIMLTPAATETKAFNDFVWKRASAICFVKSRPHFHYIDGTRAKANCGTAIVLVAYGQINAEYLNKSKLGKTIFL